MEAELYLKAYPEDYFQAFLRERVRPDGRSFDESRQIAIKLQIRGARSSIVRMGSTAVICSVDETQSPGVSVEGTKDVALGAWIRAGKAQGAVHIQVIQEDGNLLEAGLLSYQCALLSPLSSLDSVNVSQLNFAFSFCDLQKNLLRDPTRDESQLADAELAIICSGDGKLVLPLKIRGKPVALSDLERLCALAQRNVSSLLSHMPSLLSSKSFVGSLYLPKQRCVRLMPFLGIELVSRRQAAYSIGTDAVKAACLCHSRRRLTVQKVSESFYP